MKIRSNRIVFFGIIFLTFLHPGSHLFAQNSQKDTINLILLPLKHNDVEEKPLFRGTINDEFRYFVATNTKFPIKALKEGIQGRVYVSFVIDRAGKVTEAKVVKSVHPLLDKEAVRVISSSPKWTPGKQNGAPVPVLIEFPVVFKINN